MIIQWDDHSFETRLRFLVFLALFGLALQTPSHGQSLPGLWLQKPDGADDANRRLVVGGSDPQVPETAEQICLSWSWQDPTPDVELYPAADAGTYQGSENLLSLDASTGETEPSTCGPLTFPRLGLGLADELWLLGPVDSPTPGASWTDLLHAIEAFWRQSTSAPLTEQTLGFLEGCSIRSLPVTSGTQLDRWSPFELATHAEEDGTELVRTRRFLWWIEQDNESCSLERGRGELQLFPMASETSGDETSDPPTSVQYLLSITNIEWQRLGFFDLDPDDWKPGLRRLSATSASEAASKQDTGLQIRPTAAQRQLLLEGQPLDLCLIEGLGELCARNAEARRQLYSALPDPEAEIPWPQDVLEKTQNACQASLANVGAEPTVCLETDRWQQSIAGGLHTGFTGDLMIAQEPRIRETWNDGAVEWRLASGDQSPSLASAQTLNLKLLDGSTVSVNARELLETPDATGSAWQRWALGAGIVLALVMIPWMLLARRREPPSPLMDATAREELERLVVDVVDRRLQAFKAGLHTGDPQETGDPTPVHPTDRHHLQKLVQQLAIEAVESRLQSSAQSLEQQASDQIGRLTDATQELERQLQQTSTTLSEELRGSLFQEAQNLSASLQQHLEVPKSPFGRLCHELAELPDKEREPLARAFETAGRLGAWIDRLWSALQAVGGDLETIARGLPEPAAKEWGRATQALQDFSRTDAVALRRLGPATREIQTDPLSPAETAFFERAGLFENGRPLNERLKHYLAPFDHLGRLGEITLALQYLIEAYPIEQLPKDLRSKLRRDLAAIQQAAGGEDDFHALVARLAAGAGLDYRPVRYYKSRTDRSEYAFVRQQVSPISLSDRVGFEATTDKTLIVRLERPFFFQSGSGIYYAGHAHVARG